MTDYGGTLINEDTTSVTGASLVLDPVIGEYGDPLLLQNHL